MHSENHMINKLFDTEKITEEEYNILFSTKVVIVKNSIEHHLFNKTLQKIINQNRDEKILYLSGVKFLYFTFSKFTFNLQQEVDFSNSFFYYDTDFSGAIFTNQVYFMHAVFFNDTNFSIVNFLTRADFMKVTFLSKVSFQGSTSNEPLFFSNIKFKQINLVGSQFNNVDFYNIHGIDGDNIITPTKINFANKESVDKLKEYFEKQNNITEANKFFSISQEFYIDTLQQDYREPNRLSNLLVLYLNKWVSNFGTDWVRTLLMLFMLSYLFMRFYIDFDSYIGTDEHIKHFTEIADIQYIWTMFVSWGLIYLSTFYKANKLIFWSLIFSGVLLSIIGVTLYDNVLEMQNYIIQLTNPINAFKNMNLYEGLEVYGAFVRIIIVTIIYQFLVAFRQNTRRK